MRPRNRQPQTSYNYLVCANADHRGFFFFNDTATTEIYTLSLHDALPISSKDVETAKQLLAELPADELPAFFGWRSEEHTSELQSPCNLVCRLLLEKKTEFSATQRNQRKNRAVLSNRC